MPNGAVHTMAAAVAVGGLVVATAEQGREDVAVKAVAGSGVAVLGSKLPDLLEPAIHPHHRQFFHSVVFLAALGAGAYKLYKWEPETTSGEWLRFLLLGAAAGYALHLIMDGCTPRSLPFVGRLS